MERSEIRGGVSVVPDVASPIRATRLQEKVSPAMYWRVAITSVSGRRRLCKSCNRKRSPVYGDKLSCCGMA